LIGRQVPGRVSVRSLGRNSSVDHGRATGIIRRTKKLARHNNVPVAMKPEPPEVIEITGKSVACDGGGGALGHPKVFLTLDADGSVECPYCDRMFVQAKKG
jgi:uncharacterized Zn-finger protein